MLGSFTCLVSLIDSMGVIWLDKKAHKHDVALIEERKRQIAQNSSRYENPAEVSVFNPYEQDDDEGGEGGEVNWRDLFEFEKGFWLMAIDCLLTFSIMFTIIAVGTDMMQDVYGFSPLETGMHVTLPYLMCGFLVIPFGLFFDKFGNRQYYVILCGFATLSAFILFLMIP